MPTRLRTRWRGKPKTTARWASKLKIATRLHACMVAVAFLLMPTRMESWILSVSALVTSLELCAKRPSLAVCHARMEVLARTDIPGGSMRKKWKCSRNTSSCASWKDYLDVTQTTASVHRAGTFMGISASLSVTSSARMVQRVSFEVATKSVDALVTSMATSVKMNARLAV